MAALLFAIVLVFFVCHAPKAVINIYEVLYELSPRGTNSTTDVIADQKEDVHKGWHPGMAMLVNISHLLIAVNSAINIIVYAIKDLKFRQVLQRRFWLNNSQTHIMPCKLAADVAGLGCDLLPNNAVTTLTVMNDLTLDAAGGGGRGENKLENRKLMETDF